MCLRRRICFCLTSLACLFMGISFVCKSKTARGKNTVSTIPLQLPLIISRPFRSSKPSKQTRVPSAVPLEILPLCTTSQLLAMPRKETHSVLKPPPMLSGATVGLPVHAGIKPHCAWVGMFVPVICSGVSCYLLPLGSRTHMKRTF